MFCKNCGMQLPNNAAFCANCGTQVDAQPAYQSYQQPNYSYQQQAYTPNYQPAPTASDPYLEDLAGSILGKGIAGLILGFMGLPGIIVSSIAMKQTAEFVSRTGSLYGKAKVGRRLAKPGLIVGIVMTAFYTLYAILLMAAM